MNHLCTNGINLIQSFEKLRLSTYLDEAGVPTIGWGHTGPDVKLGQTCTPQQADLWFAQDTQRAVMVVNNAIAAQLTQNQFDALVSFVFNVGAGAAAGSTLFRLLKLQDWAGAAAQFDRWVHSGGHVSDGLVRRRAAEKALFLRAA